MYGDIEFSHMYGMKGPGILESNLIRRIGTSQSFYPVVVYSDRKVGNDSNVELKVRTLQ